MGWEGKVRKSPARQLPARLEGLQLLLVDLMGKRRLGLSAWAGRAGRAVAEGMAAGNAPVVVEDVFVDGFA